MRQEIIFQNQQNNNTISFHFQLNSQSEEFNLSEIIHQFNQNQPSTNKRRFYIYDTQKSIYTDIIDFNSISLKYLGYMPILIKYTQAVSISQQQSNAELQLKKQRIKQRSIKQALYYVQKWRNFHKLIGPNGKKINLQDAAKMVGISKKSLDDYYCQLRLGQKYGFNFQENIEAKIGVLRNFIRQHKPKNMRTNKNQKHPRKLKIIENHKQQIESLGLFSETSRELSSLESSILTTQHQYQYEYKETPMSIIQEQQLQNQFYQFPEIMMGEPIDPFVPYTAQEYRNFKKSEYRIQNESNKYVDYQQFEIQKFW